jgi:hypothetical protein
MRWNELANYEQHEYYPLVWKMRRKKWYLLMKKQDEGVNNDNGIGFIIGTKGTDDPDDDNDIGEDDMVIVYLLQLRSLVDYSCCSHCDKY